MSDPGEMERRSASLESARTRLIEEYRGVANELLNARFDEFRDVVVAGEPTSPAAGARFVREEASYVSFIPSPVELGAPLPVNEQDLHELYRTNGLITPADEAELGCRLPLIRELPTPSDFERLLEDRRAEEARGLPLRSDLWATTTDDLSGLESLLDAAIGIAAQ